jgi:hypothetical protein
VVTVDEPSSVYLSGDGVTSGGRCGGQGAAEDLRGAAPVGPGWLGGGGSGGMPAPRILD